MVYTASAMTSGMIDVLRNPIDASYVRGNAAIGTLSECIRIEEITRSCKEHSLVSGPRPVFLGVDILLLKGTAALLRTLCVFSEALPLCGETKASW